MGFKDLIERKMQSTRTYNTFTNASTFLTCMYVQPMYTVTWYLNERPNCKANSLH